MLKIFLTSDNHIGLKYAHYDKSCIISSSRINAFDAMVKKANDENCNMFVIAGDLFEKNKGISKKDIKFLLEKLSKFNGVVVVLPGNHDYYGIDVKLWQDFKEIMRQYDNIMLLTEYKDYELQIEDNDVIIYPALCTSHHSLPGENNLGWIENENIIPDNKYRIGIAHGAVEGETIDSEGVYFLMKRSELERIPVDVWLIGHTHIPFPSYLEENSYISGDTIFNAGTHVQTDVSCHTEGFCFIIRIEENKRVSAKKVHSGNIHFYRKDIDISGYTLADRLKVSLADLEDNSVVDLNIRGAISSDEYEKRSEIIEQALSRFIEGTYNDHELTKIITEDIINSEFSETSFSAGFLKALLDEPKEAQLVYELLQTIKGDK